MQRILILAHREELIYQAVQHARNAGLTAGVEMGSQWARNEQVVVSTVQTMNSRGRSGVRMEKFDPWDFGLIITDEAHHGTAKSYRNVYSHFKQNRDAKFLFVTATPKRADGIGLHNICESVAYEMDLRDAIELGWLCPIRQQFVTVEALDLSRVGTKRGGDLKDGELEKAFLGNGDLEEEELLHKIAKPTIDACAGQLGIVFASGVVHAEKLTAAFNAYSDCRAECVIGTTDKEIRRGIIRRFKAGETQILVNVGVATEGFDAPAAAVVAVARPTKSESLYMQMIGRGTRTLPGVVDGPDTPELRRAAIAASAKPACRVLDFVGNSGDHKLVSVGDLLAGEDIQEEDIAAAIVEARESAEPVDMRELMERARTAREERERKSQEEAERLEAEYNAKRLQSTEHYAESANYTAIDVDLFAGRNFDPYTDYKPAPDGATPGQVKYLLGLGVPAVKATSMTKRQAGKVIDDLTKKQVGGEYRLPFGKHKGKKLSELPRHYLEWAKTNIGSEKFHEHIAIMEGRNVDRASQREEPF